MVKENKRMEMNGTHKILIYGNEINRLDENIKIIQENTLLGSCNEDG
jgi:hypothetical protein